MFKAERFMVCAGDIRRDAKKMMFWSKFIVVLMGTKAWKATGYDTWSPDGGDWGWMSSSAGRGDIGAALVMFRALGFSVSGHQSDAMTARVDAQEGCEALVKKVVARVDAEGAIPLG